MKDSVLMGMLVMDLRHMGVSVLHRFVGMLMAVFSRYFTVMMMRMVSVAVRMSVRMGFLNMSMRVFMLLGDGKIGSDEHDCQCDEEGAGYGIPQHDPGYHYTDKGRRRIVDACARSTQLTLSGNIKENAKSIGDKSKQQGQHYERHTAVNPICPEGYQKGAEAGTKAFYDYDLKRILQGQHSGAVVFDPPAQTGCEDEE